MSYLANKTSQTIRTESQRAKYQQLATTCAYCLEIKQENKAASV